MQFLKILFWCLIAFIAAVFTIGNWTSVPIQLWGGLVAETNLPMLLLLAFLVGLVPTLVYHRFVRWRLRQRLGAAERQIADLHALTAAPRLPADPVIAAMPAAAGAVPPGSADGDGTTGPGWPL